MRHPPVCILTLHQFVKYLPFDDSLLSSVFLIMQSVTIINVIGGSVLLSNFNRYLVIMFLSLRTISVESFYNFYSLHLSGNPNCSSSLQRLFLFIESNAFSKSTKFTCTSSQLKLLMQCNS